MLIQLAELLAIISACTSALLAGIYFIFHNTIMPVLAQYQAMPIMQEINRVIQNRRFLSIFMLSPLSGAFAIGMLLLSGELSDYWLMLLGASTALLGFMVTVFLNVPLNEGLKQASETQQALWRDYLVTWGRWNLLRYYLSLIALLAYLIQLMLS